MNVYDRNYRKEKYFGEPYKALKEFFSERSMMFKQGTLLDLGAGQGRDSLFAADLGFEVTAVDLSSVGLAKIREENSGIKTVQADIFEYEITNFDYVLIDAVLFFYQKNIVKETKFINDICDSLPIGGIIVNCMVKSLRTERIFKEIMDQSIHKFKIIDECYTEYPEQESEFYFIALQKV